MGVSKGKMWERGWGETQQNTQACPVQMASPRRASAVALGFPGVTTEKDPGFRLEVGAVFF